NYFTDQSRLKIVTDKVSERVYKSLDERQIEWLDKVLKQKSWIQTDEFKKYVNQFTEDVCDRVTIPCIVCNSERLEAPTRIENKSLDYERTYSIDTTIFIINQLFCMHQDMVELVWIELTTPIQKITKLMDLLK
ncbi:3690_t:CDS:2, partial [Entrophospora sp. SA101]